ncbi:hypothetical protein DTO96_102409 [Ephemeroptericola cinctiostellae]|uniref:Lipoprotein n=1 Tax=Ephemeroptericola cinctiostellae TaxID=2268024 RepID=A0A345DE66_9BURK|nr:hypothetical protein [Ephemeroptericola cinctiostellae]AXF86654.1 hypothetical protein DTO96_102409 [Ephemeroptericola cinctiostellae]
MKISALFISTALTITACGKSEPVAVDKSIPAETFLKSGYVDSVNDRSDISNPKALVLHIDGLDRVFMLSNRFMLTLDQLKNDRPEILDQYSEVWVFADAKLQDKYGNESKKKIYAVAWRSDDLKKANLKNMYERDILNLAADVRIYHPVGMNITNDFCKNDKGEKDAPNFCKKL